MRPFVLVAGGLRRFRMAVYAGPTLWTVLIANTVLLSCHAMQRTPSTSIAANEFHAHLVEQTSLSSSKKSGNSGCLRVVPHAPILTARSCWNSGTLVK